MSIESSQARAWLRVGLYLVALVVVSLSLAYLLQYLIVHFDISLQRFTSVAYLFIFGMVLVANLVIMVPVAVHIPVLMAASSHFNPITVALVASLAGTLGEVTGYYAGYMGKRIVHTEGVARYNKLVAWMKKYGMMAIFVLSIQPILPVDIAGLIAGSSKVPLRKFLFACWAGKFPKYFLLCYFGFGLLKLLPFQL